MDLDQKTELALSRLLMYLSEPAPYRGMTGLEMEAARKRDQRSHRTFLAHLRAVLERQQARIAELEAAEKHKADVLESNRRFFYGDPEKPADEEPAIPSGAPEDDRPKHGRTYAPWPARQRWVSLDEARRIFPEPTERPMYTVERSEYEGEWQVSVDGKCKETYRTEIGAYFAALRLANEAGR